MKLYVASKFENQKEVRSAIARLRAAGHTITRDWTRGKTWDWNDQAQVERYARAVAVADAQAVADADAFVFLTYEYRTNIGAFVEMGIALGLGKLVFVVGEQPRNLFYYHPNVRRVRNIDEVIGTLRLLERVLV